MGILGSVIDGTSREMKMGEEQTKDACDIEEREVKK